MSRIPFGLCELKVPGDSCVLFGIFRVDASLISLNRLEEVLKTARTGFSVIDGV